MQHNDQGRPLLIVVMVALIGLALLLISFGAVLLVANWVESDASLPTPGQIAERSTPAPALSETDAVPSVSATLTSTVAPSSLELVPSTVTSTTSPPSPTVVPPSATSAPSPTVVPPTATRAPTVVPPTATRAPTATATVSISVVTVPLAYVRNGPSTDNSIIGGVEQGVQLVVLGSSGTWYLVRVHGVGSSRSRIEGGQGWIAQTLVSPPSRPVPLLRP